MLTAVLAVSAAVVLAGCDGGEPSGQRVGEVGTGIGTSTSPGADPSQPTEVTGDVAGRQRARLDVLGGASSVVVRAAELGDRLFRASTPRDAQPPGVTIDGDVVRLSLHGGASELLVELNADVAWELRLDGGASSESVDMAAGRLTALDFGAGSSSIDVALPRPRGTVPVRMTGGASTMDLHLPTGTAARVTFAGGAGQATIDGTRHTGIAGGTTLGAPDWDTATDRYLLDLVAGVSALTLDRTPS